MFEKSSEIEHYNDNIDSVDLPVFTRSQLSIYNGVNNPKVYIGIKGYVYDVTTNLDSYGPGKSYNTLTGKEVTRLFAINKLKVPEGDGDQKLWDIDDLSDKQKDAVVKWIEFFHCRYKVVGIIGDHVN